MSVKPEISQIAENAWSQRPHPQAPSVKIGDYPLAARLATSARFGGHATPPEVEAFWKEFQQLGMSPAEFTQYMEQAAPRSFTYHGRPPSMTELAKFKESKSTPSEIGNYYAQLPDQHYPAVSAGDMLKNLSAGEPWALMHLKRKPTKNEAAYLHHSGDKPQAFYQALAQQMAQQGGGGAAPAMPQGGPDVSA